jgi:hypothetical protein
LDDFVAFTRRPGQFVPSNVDEIKRPHEQAKKARQMFYEMKRDTDRKRLAADVEIKIRAIYFDRIERKEVITLIDSIYEHVKSLEDMQFLVQYATSVFPPEVKDANGDKIWHNILDLQDDLIQKREVQKFRLSLENCDLMFSLCFVLRRPLWHWQTLSINCIQSRNQKQ